MREDVRSCSTCINNENGVCAFTGEKVKNTDYCSNWDPEEQEEVRVRYAKKGKAKYK